MGRYLYKCRLCGKIVDAHFAPDLDPDEQLAYYCWPHSGIGSHIPGFVIHECGAYNTGLAELIGASDDDRFVKHMMGEDNDKE